MITREMQRFRGSGGGGGGKGGGSGSSAGPREAPNTLQANSIIKVLDLLGEGKIRGPVNDLQSVFLNETPLVAADGETFNFRGVQIAWRDGDPDQEAIEGFEGASTPASVNAEVKHLTDMYSGAVIRRIDDLDADAARIILALNALTAQDTQTGDLNGYTVTVAIDVKSEANLGGSTYSEVIYDTISGKTTSPWQKSYRIPLEGDGPWDVRMRRISIDETETTKQNKTTWLSYSVLKDDKFSYPHSALMAMEIDVSQFGGDAPGRAVELYGLIVQVPTNYDPETRTYTGIWDGTFKLEYCNNPAWVLWDVVSSKRYGIGDLIDVSRVSKWDLYTIAKYCDGHNLRPSGTTDDYHPTTGKHGVPDLEGGFEPVFTFNGVLNTKETAYKALMAIAGMMRVSLMWTSGLMSFTQDVPKASTKIFTRANVIEGTFNYSGTALRARHTVCNVSYVEPTKSWKSETLLVDNKPGIRRYGYNDLSISAYGCTSKSQAIRHARYALLTEYLETDSVQFRIGVGEADLLPGHIIKIVDPMMTEAEWAGRLQVIAGDGLSLTLDRMVEFDEDRTYTLTTITADGAIVEREIVNPGIETSEIVLTAALDTADLPVVNAMFAITTDVVEERMFRVMTIGEDGPDKFKIFAVEYAPEKFQQILDGISLVTPPVVVGQDPAFCQPPGAIAFQYQAGRSGGTSATSLLTTWEESPDQYLRGYLVSYQEGYDNVVSLPEQRRPEFRLDNPKFGVFRVWVTAISRYGKVSSEVTRTVDLSTGTSKDKILVSNLSVPSGGTNWAGRDLPVTWKARPIMGGGNLMIDGKDPYFKQFKVFLRAKPVSGTYLPTYDENGDITAEPTTLLKTYTTQDPNFVIPYQDMADLGLAREYVIGVVLEDIAGDLSREERNLFQNPAPELVPATFNAGPLSVFMKFVKPLDPDYAGVLLWVSQVDGFTPGPGNLIWQTDGAPVFACEPEATYYVRYAYYDAFGLIGITTSAQVSVTTPSLAPYLEIPDLEELRDEVDEARARGEETRRDLNRLAIAAMRTNLTEVRQNVERDTLTHFSGLPLGSVVQQEMIRTDTSLHYLDLMGGISVDGLAYVLNETSIRFTSGFTIAETFESITTTFNGNLASLNTSMTAYTDALESRVEAEFVAIVDFNDYTGTIIDSVTAVANDLGVVIDRVGLIGAESGDGLSFILDMDTVKISPTESFAQRTSLIESRFNGTTSSYILSQANTAATDASAALNTLVQMGVTIGAGGAWTLDSTDLIVAPGETLATRLSSIGSFQGGESARVDSRISAQTGPGGSIATWAAGVYSTQGELEAAAGLSFSSIGAQASAATLYVVSGGIVGGISAGSNLGYIDLKFLAHKFMFVDPAGGNPINALEYTSGAWTLNGSLTINGNVIINGTIQTAGMAANAVTNGASSRTAGVVYCSSNTFVQSCAMSTVGGRIRIDFSFNLFGSATSPVDVIGTIYRNGTLVWYGIIGRMNGQQRVFVGPAPGPDDWVDIPGGLNAGFTGFFVDSGSTAGYNDYHFYIEAPGGAVEVSERNTALLELKR